MDEREDYVEGDWDPRRWDHVARKLLKVGLLLGLAMLAAGIITVKVVEMRRIRLPEVPGPDEIERGGESAGVPAVPVGRPLNGTTDDDLHGPRRFRKRTDVSAHSWSEAGRGRQMTSSVTSGMPWAMGFGHHRGGTYQARDFQAEARRRPWITARTSTRSGWTR